jgi:hypothetical protein
MGTVPEIFLTIVPNYSEFNDPVALPFSLNFGKNHHNTNSNYSYFFLCYFQNQNNNLTVLNELFDLSKNKKLNIRDRNRLNLFIKQNPDSIIQFEVL